MSDDPVLFDRLEPPPDGYARLTVRRDERSSARLTGLALVGGVTVAALSLRIIEPPRPAVEPLSLPASAARLIDAPATGEPAQVDDTPTETVSSEGAGVKLYWIGDER